MNFYERRILPHVIDCACGAQAYMGQRAWLAPQACGVVLDVGVSAGLNLGFYDHFRVVELIGLDPCRVSLAKAHGRAARLGLPFRSIEAGAEAIPLDDASVDCAVMTFTLCTVPDVAGALREVRRVLRPGGALLFCEHGLAHEAQGLRKLQRVFDPLWARVFGGCRLVREPERLLQDAGFRLAELKAGRVRGAPALVSYQMAGVALPA